MTPDNDTVTKGAPRVGILGCSDIARRKFIPALLQSRAILTAIASRSGEKAAGFLPEVSYEPLDYDGMISSGSVDLIYISLPNHLHEEWAVKALQGGKHVICEKPLGLNAASVERMLSCAEANGRLLYENLMFLHHPQHAAVKKLIDSGAIGAVQSVRSVFGFPRPAAGDFRNDPSKGGGACHDLSRYILGTADYFLHGGLSSMNGFAVNRNGLNVGMYGTAATSGNEIFLFSACFGQQYESFYEIIGETGKVTVDRAYTTPPEMANRIRVVRGDRDESFTVEPADHFQLMIDRVCNLITGNGNFAPEHDRAKRIALLADELEKGCSHVEI